MSFADNFFGRSFSARLIVWFVGASMVLVLTTSGLLYLALGQAMEWRDDQVLETRAATLRQLLIATKIDVEYLDHEVSEDLEGPRQVFMRIAGPPAVGLHETPLMPEQLKTENFPDVSAAPSGEYRYATITGTGARSFRAVAVRIELPAASGGGWTIIHMARESSADVEIMLRYAELIAIIVAVCLCISVLGGWSIVQIQMRPLAKLAGDLAKIQHSKLNYRVSLNGLPTELEEAAAQFNHMLARLENAYVGLRRYADDVAHELRTPLNRLLLSTEVALSETRTAETYRGALESNLEECAHLNQIVKSLLFIARAEHGQSTISHEPLDVAANLEKIRDFFESSASDSGISLTLECPTALSLSADKTLFQRAISNVVANALAHTPRGGSVAIRAQTSETGVDVEVLDTGEGIALHDQPYVFDRFFRGDKARRTDQDRVGLGLGITKSIMDMHLGSISLDSCAGQGSKFTLSFPNS